MSQKEFALAGGNNEILIRQFLDFINNHPPSRVARHLRTILLEYIAQELDTGLPIDFDDTLREMFALFDLLDAASEMGSTKIKE